MRRLPMAPARTGRADRVRGVLEPLHPPGHEQPPLDRCGHVGVSPCVAAMAQGQADRRLVSQRWVRRAFSGMVRLGAGAPTTPTPSAVPFQHCSPECSITVKSIIGPLASGGGVGGLAVGRSVLRLGPQCRAGESLGALELRLPVHAGNVSSCVPPAPMPNATEARVRPQASVISFGGWGRRQAANTPPPTTT